MFVVVVQLASHVWLFATPWTAAWQASLSLTISRSLLKFMTTESVMLCYLTISSSAASFSSCLQSFSAYRVFSSESVLHIRQLEYWSFSPASILPMNIQYWFPLGLTGLISQESSPAPQFESISSSALSLLYGPTLASVHDYWKNLWLLIPVSSRFSFCCFCLPTAM